MSLSKNTPQNSSQSVDSTATTKPCKNLVVRIDQDSDDNLQALFDSVLNPSDSKRPLQVPFRMRKLPNSFFNPPANTRTATGTGTSAHSRTNSADSAYGAGSQSSVNQDTIVSHSTDSQKPSTISSQQNVTNRLTIYHSRAHSSPASLQQTYSIQTNNINENNPPPPENANYVADIFSPTVNGNNAINSESDRRSSGSKSTVVAFHAKTRSYDVISPIQLYNELGALPPGWEQARTNDGQIYYLNHLTKSTQWEDPRLQIKETQQRNFQQPPNQSDSAEVTSIDANLGPLPEGWEQALTESGDVYFINHVNRTTSWNDPRIPEYLQKPVKIAKPEMLWINSPELGKEVAVVKQKLEQNPINSTTTATINMDPFLSGDNHARQESSDSGLSLSSNTFSLNATDFISQIDESMDCISESGLNGIDCPEHLVSSLQLEDNICNEMFDDVHNILHSPNAKPDNLEWYKIN